ILLNAISGIDENDYTSKETKEDFTTYLGKDIKDLHIGVPTYFMSDKVDEEVREKVLEIIHHLMKQGCIVDEVDIPYLEYAIPLYQIIGLGEASSNLARFDGVKYGYKAKEYKTLEEMYENTRSVGFGEEVKRRIMIGTFMLSGENANHYYHKALKVRQMLTDGFEKAFKKYDLLIGPTNTNVAYPLGQKGDDALKSFFDDILTIPVNMAGLPAMSLPIGFTENHLPIGLHVIASHFEEGKIYTLASYLEKQLNLSLNPGKGEDKAC
ncbi:MAG: Asp-tRNA(Asn)/Glu-tRNA(Gln) amidotransferase subunit GatA, partial [Firmicutes bacterium]|nr:Asp-tRNA(Asn)/Glu-tRNA(Gln) amidotransferase subunit GatA [Bacillota bacterium]